jgi:GAF domain
MTSTTAAQAFADAASRMVSRSDIAGDLVLLLIDCADLLSAEAVGLLVAVPDNGLELLSSSTHQARELEAYELQNGTGPCIDAIRLGEHVTAISPELDSAWAPLGARIVAHGFRSVHAFPLTWHGTAIGALNVFHADAVVLDDGDRLLAGTFADLATAVLARPLDWRHGAASADHGSSRRTYRDRAGQRRHRLPGEPGDERRIQPPAAAGDRLRPDVVSGGRRHPHVRFALIVTGSIISISPRIDGPEEV